MANTTEPAFEGQTTGARRRRVIVELRASAPLANLAALAMTAPALPTAAGLLPELEALSWDQGFGPVEIPENAPPERGFGAFGPLMEGVEPGEGPTYIVRGEVADDQLEVLQEAAAGHDQVVGVFSDPLISALLTCGGDPAVGGEADVARLLCVDALGAAGMDGRDVLVAVVDTGINLAHLTSRGKHPGFDAARSWSFTTTLTPGSAPLAHGSMCAYDVCIAAPECTLADLVLLRPASFVNLLSDAVLAYNHLLRQIRSTGLFGQYRALVVTNSWGMFSPSTDFPVGTRGNYSDNPQHPFNRIVTTLERFGADILFAAGNCGPDCPDLRCGGIVTRTIYGASSHPDVLSVAGVDTTKRRVGYSSTGPGRLVNQKPDLCGYTHFAGSGVFPVDSGTSAATPVAAGVVAALRSRFRYDPARPDTDPAALRQHVLDHVDNLGMAGHSLEYGWGIIDGCQLAAAPFPT